ncbi:MAG TPA: PRC-barrel domain-containing protein [Vitreimonas sp.]|nr:PRC-barrel domain-containing protein [Vitreimonas sp.]
MNVDRLKGMTIVSIGDAERLGSISDVLFATDPLRVAALEASAGDSRFVVPFDQVRKLGTDAVTVDSRQVTQAGSAAAAGELSRLSRLHELKVVDEGGTFLGVVEAVGVDETSGHVTELVARRGGVMGLGGDRTTLAAQDIRSVGSEVLTVATPHVERSPD